MRDPIAFSTQAYAPLAAEVARHLEAAAGRLEREAFPDGERYLRLADEVARRDVVIVGGTISDADALEVFDVACTCVSEGARSIALVVPYFGYATMERAVKPGEVVVAKARARLLSAVPRAHAGNTAVLLDLHADGIPYYFGDALGVRHVSAKPVIAEAIRSLGPDVVVAATDAGRAKWVERLANEMRLPAAFCYKTRLGGSSTRVTGIDADVTGRTVALYDDMLRTGGSMREAARAYRSGGAKRVVALTTHLLPPAGALEALRADGAIERVIATDSHPRAAGHDPAFVEVRPVAALLAAAAERRGE